MIGFLDGKVAGATRDGCFVDVGGVGYRVACSATTMAQLPAEGERVRLWIHTHVREDTLGLFGFATPDEQFMFEALLGVSGVGPKVALAICSAFPPDRFRRALATDDVDALSAVPGIGRKTAQRILIDLKEKMQVPDLEVVGAGRDAVSAARAALHNLGYTQGEVRLALDDVEVDEGSVEDVVRAALKTLAVRTR